jgi:DNA polymerase III alpha subunit
LALTDECSLAGIVRAHLAARKVRLPLILGSEFRFDHALHPVRDSDDLFADTAGNVAGLLFHAGVATKVNERDKLERLCRYIVRPAVSENACHRTHKARYAMN